MIDVVLGAVILMILLIRMATLLVLLGRVLARVGMALGRVAGPAGVLGVAGALVAAAVVGALMAGSGAALAVTVPVAVALAAVGVVAVLLLAHAVAAAHAQEIRTGPTALVGSLATVRTWSGREGQVTADGALWRARPAYSWEDPQPAPGQAVVVGELDGLTVIVRRPNPWEVRPVWKPSSLSL